MLQQSSLDDLELDVLDVERLLGLASRRLVKGKLLLLLNELNQEKKSWQEQALSSLASLQLGGCSQGHPVLPPLPQGSAGLSPPPPPPLPPMQNGYGQYAPQQQTLASLQTTASLLALMKERGLQPPMHLGGPGPSSQPGPASQPGSNGASAAGALHYDGIWGNGQNAQHAQHLSPSNRNSANGTPWSTAAPLSSYRPNAGNGMDNLDVGLPVTSVSPSSAVPPYSAPMLGNYLGGPPPQLAPFGFGASLLGNGDFTFRMLTTCSWEQSDTMVKVYVPLRGVQTELLRSHFTMTSVEIKVYNLQGKNYIFTVMPTCKQILGEACVAVASKTKKNILITIQKLSSALPDERHWRDLFGVPAGGSQPNALPKPTM